MRMSSPCEELKPVRRTKQRMPSSGGLLASPSTFFLLLSGAVVWIRDVPLKRACILRALGCEDKVKRSQAAAITPGCQTLRPAKLDQTTRVATRRTPPVLAKTVHDQLGVRPGTHRILHLWHGFGLTSQRLEATARRRPTACKRCFVHNGAATHDQTVARHQGLLLRRRQFGEQMTHMYCT